MRPKISLIGNTYWRLTVVSESKIKTSDNKIRYNCICICGNTKTVSRANLKSGDSKSCGCLLKEVKEYQFNNNIDILGNRYGRLVVLGKKFIGKKKYWECKCDCGVIKNILETSLRQGGSKSCGCIQKESLYIGREFIKKHLETVNKLKTVEYTAWLNMKSRCLNKKNKHYQYYGERGIKICDEWVYDFDIFLKDVGRKPSKKHSLDRIDVNGDYCKENCRWTTSHEQGVNRRHVIFCTKDEITLCKKDWAKKLNVSYYIFNKTLKKLNNFEDTYNYLMNT